MTGVGAHLWQWVRTQREIPIPPDTEAFDVTDWIRFYWMHDKDYWDFRDDIPNVAPPFRHYFMFGEWTAETKVAGETRVHKGELGQLGVLFQSERLKDGRFVVSGSLCGGLPGHHRWQPLMWAWRADSEWRFMAATDEAEREGKGPMIMGDSRSRPEDLKESTVILTPFLIATSILHCGNVTATRIHPSRQMRRAAERSGVPIYTFSVLDVGPVKKTLREAGSEQGGIRRALHVCRGHFKDYRDGSGLFGRYRGLFWWDQALRGDGPRVHDKTYNVRASR